MKTKDVDLYMRIVHEVSKQSTCNRLKVGAAIVTENQTVFLGYNGTPPGYDNCCEGEDGLTKPEVIHAEMNALAKIAVSHESSDGATVFLTHAPCQNCAKMLQRAKVKKVYFKEVYRTFEGVELLQNFNIEVEQI
jgi:dCMP deaminase